MANLGIDVGGSGIKGAPVDIRSGLLTAERVRLDTPRPAKVEPVVSTILEVAANFPGRGAVGVTFPGVIVDGTVQTAANLHKSWIGVNLQAILSERLGRKVVVLNDADAAGLAEVHYGVAQQVNGVVVMLTFGTGVGSALFVDGKLVPNTELGHLEWQGKDAETRVAASVKDAKGWTWKQWAIRANSYLELVERLFSPQLIVIGGGLSNQPDRWLPKIKSKAPCVAAAHANEAGIIGAAAATVAGRTGRK